MLPLVVVPDGVLAFFPQDKSPKAIRTQRIFLVGSIVSPNVPIKILTYPYFFASVIGLRCVEKRGLNREIDHIIRNLNWLSLFSALSRYFQSAYR